MRIQVEKLKIGHMEISKPTEKEYNDFFKVYIDLVPTDNLLLALRESNDNLVKLFRNIPPEIEVFRYDTNKWSIKEVLMHIIDFERYMTFKAFVSLRNDHETILHHPKREHYLFNAGSEKRNLNDLIPEFISVRSATISLFQHSAVQQLSHIVNHANENHAISARALGFALVGHSLHHMEIIKERYVVMT
jgi:hypothetical protein